MTKDILESALLALITVFLLGPVAAIMVAVAWFYTCRYLRRRQLDTDYEHINHPRHRDLYKS